MQDMEALMCGHVYCKYCIERLPFDVSGALPVYLCIKCTKWKVYFTLCKF